MSGHRRFGRVRRLPSGRWQARHPAPDGAQRTAPRTFATKTDATRYLATVEADILRGHYRDPLGAVPTVAEWGSRYLAGRAPTIKPSTLAGYESLLRTCIVPTLGATALNGIRRSDTRDWVASLSTRVGPSRVRKALVLLSLLLDAAVDDGLVSANVVRGLRGPRLPSPEPTVLTPAQVAGLRAAIREPYGVLVDVLAYAGLRLGEVLALRRRDVDLLRGRLLVRRAVAEVSGRHHVGTPKTHQHREVTLPRFLAADLAAHLDAEVATDPDTLLFPNRVGRHLHYTTLRRNIWDPACRAAGLPGLTPHALRATCGSWTADLLGVLAAAQRLGHSNASVTTRHYARARAGIQDDAADRLDDLRAAEHRSEGARSGHAGRLSPT